MLQLDHNDLQSCCIHSCVSIPECTVPIFALSPSFLVSCCNTEHFPRVGQIKDSDTHFWTSFSLQPFVCNATLALLGLCKKTMKRDVSVWGIQTITMSGSPPPVLFCPPTVQENGTDPGRIQNSPVTCVFHVRGWPPSCGSSCALEWAPGPHDAEQLDRWMSCILLQSALCKFVYPLSTCVFSCT